MDDDGGIPDHARALASHHGFVRELARGLVAPDAFEDVAHEALLAGLERSLERPAALRGWLATTVRRLAGRWRRGEARRTRREVAAAQSEALPSAHELVERIELEQAVVRAVLELKEPFRTTVLLRFYEGHATAAIATQLRLPADTVRARLRRGLAELRTQLDARFGSRTEWIAALLPVAALPTGVATTVATPVATNVAAGSGTSGAVGSGSALKAAAAAAATTGAAVMGVKTIGTVVASCATAALAWWVVPEAWLERTLAPASIDSARERGAAEGAGVASVDTAGARDDAVAATRSAEGAAELVEDETVAVSSLPPPGAVFLEVIDARTHARLDGVKIRFLNASRFAEYEGAGGVQTILTAGHWEANVTAEGYEPARLAGFDLGVSEAKSLGRIPLDRGNGVVEGRVVARHLPGDAPVTVELFGAGRSPCDACLAALHGGGGDDAERMKSFGADCGYAKDRDVFAVRGDRSFRFAHLAAGVYWVRASDPQQRIVEARRIEVGRGGCTWQELDVSAPTFARFELRHERGGLFTGAWSNPHSPAPAPIRYEFRRGDQVVGNVEHTPSADDTLASVGPPIVIPVSGETHVASEVLESLAMSYHAIDTFDRAILSVGAANFVGLREGQWFETLATHDAGLLNERLDRERREGDELRFDCAEPGSDGVALRIEAVRPDLHEIRPLPRFELTLVVTCGEYRSEEIPVDLRADYFQPTVVTMRLPPRETGPAGSGAPSAGACASCHDRKPDAVQALERTSFWRTRAAQVEFAAVLNERLEAIDTVHSIRRREKP